MHPLVWEYIILLKSGLLNPYMQERSFSVTLLDRITVNMTSCSEVEEETDKEDGRKEDCSRETDKTVASLEAMPIHLNWAHIFSLPNDTRQYMVVTLQHPEIHADKVKGVVEMSYTPVQFASCNTTVTFTDDDLLLGSKPHNHPP